MLERSAKGGVSAFPEINRKMPENFPQSGKCSPLLQNHKKLPPDHASSACNQWLTKNVRDGCGLALPWRVRRKILLMGGLPLHQDLVVHGIDLVDRPQQAGPGGFDRIPACPFDDLRKRFARVMALASETSMGFLIEGYRFCSHTH